MSQENLELVRALYRRLGQGDYFGATEFGEDLVFARHGKVLGLLEGEWHGVGEIRSAVLEYLRSWEDLRNELVEIREVDDDRVLVFERQVGRGRASGLVMEQEMASLFTLRDRKIIRWEAYWERADAVKAAGLSE